MYNIFCNSFDSRRSSRIGKQKSYPFSSSLENDFENWFNDVAKKKEELHEVAKTFEIIIKKTNPANVFYEKNTENIGNLRLSWFDFKGYAIDCQIYYIYYVTSIGGNLLHGIFSCVTTDVEAYKEVAFLVIKSIQDLSEEI